MFITGPLSALPYTWVTVIPVLLFAGGAGHLGAWAGVCQRVTDGAELLPANPPSQWQVRAITTSCNGSFSGETQQFWRLNTRMKWLYCCGKKIVWCTFFSLRLSSTDSATLCGNLEEILTFQQGLCVALEECTKYVICAINDTSETPSLWSRAVLGPIGSILLVGAEDKCDIFSSIYGVAHMLSVQTFCREIQLNIFSPSCFLPQSSTSLWIFYCITKAKQIIFFWND